MSTLYTPEILQLALRSGAYPPLATPDQTERATARACGSRMTLGLSISDGRVSACGLDLHACAVGQAAAVWLADRLQGAPLADALTLHQDALAVLQGSGHPDMAAFAHLLHWPGRHDAFLMPFAAAARVAARQGRGLTDAA